MSTDNIEHTNNEDVHPLDLFLSMLNAPDSRRQYPGRLQIFFNFLNLKGDIKEQALSFVNYYKHQDNDGAKLEGRLIAFAKFQKERVEKKEISPATVPNYFKAVKLFCQANRLSKNIEWKNISKTMPRGLNAADDRAPTLEEIQKILEFPDRRIKPIVLTLVSSGIRIGAFDNLKWKHITPIHNQQQQDNDSSNNSNSMIKAAKILVYPGDREQYYSFLTPEAYTAVKDWMDYRAACGEEITKESLVMREIWQNGDEEGAAKPEPLDTDAITRLLNRAWQAQRIRPKLQKGQKRHEFKTAHGFRKYFKTQMEQARVPSIKVEMLLGHSLGVSDSYARFTEEQMLQDYIQGIEYLTVNQNIVLINKSIKQQGEYIQQSLKEMEEKHQKEIESLDVKHSAEIDEINQQMAKNYDMFEETTARAIKTLNLVQRYKEVTDERLNKYSKRLNSSQFVLIELFKALSPIVDLLNTIPEHRETVAGPLSKISDVMLQYETELEEEIENHLNKSSKK